jgi:hypothetical protein
MRRPPAGRDPCRNAVNARNERRLRLGGVRASPDGQRNDPDRGEPSSHLTNLHVALR